MRKQKNKKAGQWLAFALESALAGGFFRDGDDIDFIVFYSAVGADEFDVVVLFIAALFAHRGPLCFLGADFHAQSAAACKK